MVDPIVRWARDEAERLAAAHGDAVVVTVLAPAEPGFGDALLRIDDPHGRGWRGTARLVDARDVDGTVDFTVLLEASPRSARRPCVHLWGVDVRDDGGTVHVSADTPWRIHAPGDPPVLDDGVARLVRGGVPYRRAVVGPARLTPRYGA